MTRQKQILVTNDDGYESEGLQSLIEAMRPLGRVITVAPANEKSACGHSLTLTRPLRLIHIDDDFYKLEDGTPSDCVYMALHTLFDTPPDIVVSGINKGANLGEDITYSGTASAAMEAALHDIPSIAFSQLHRQLGDHSYVFDYSIASRLATQLTSQVLTDGFPLQKRMFMNVNVPVVSAQTFRGVQITRAGYREYGNDAHMHRNPRGEEYFWLGLHPLRWGEYPHVDQTIMSDFDAVKNGYASVSPIKLDMTAYEEITPLTRWLKHENI